MTRFVLTVLAIDGEEQVVDEVLCGIGKILSMRQSITEYQIEREEPIATVPRRRRGPYTQEDDDA